MSRMISDGVTLI